MSNKTKIVNFKDRRGHKFLPYTVGPGIGFNDGNKGYTVDEYISLLYTLLNQIYSTDKGGEVMEKIKQTGQFKNYIVEDKVIGNIVNMDGEDLKLVETKDYTGTINYPVTSSKAVKVNNPYDDSTPRFNVLKALKPEGLEIENLQEELNDLRRLIEMLFVSYVPLELKSFAVSNDNIHYDEESISMGLGILENLFFKWSSNKFITSQTIKVYLKENKESEEAQFLEEFNVIKADFENGIDDEGHMEYRYNYEIKLTNPLLINKPGCLFITFEGFSNSERVEDSLYVLFSKFAVFGVSPLESFKDYMLFNFYPVSIDKDNVIDDFTFNCGNIRMTNLSNELLEDYPKYGYIIVPAECGIPKFEIFIDDTCLGTGGFKLLNYSDETNEIETIQLNLGDGLKDVYIFRTAHKGIGKLKIKTQRNNTEV